jgi:subtilisin family serine protease
MKKNSFKLNEKASISLVSLIRRQTRKIRPSTAARALGFSGTVAEAISKDDIVDLLVEATSAKELSRAVDKTEQGEQVERLVDGYYSAHVRVDTADQILKAGGVARVQSKKKSQPTLREATTDIGLRTAPGAARQVAETGKDVLIGVVDTGFDLSHPMFRDPAGALRVIGLLDQTAVNKEFTTAELETGWAAGGSRPGADGQGHGTHVASIAGGSPFQGLEGVAPEAKFLLVKTDFVNTDKAVAWVFGKAGGKPCAVNLSLGHHFGAHDGTDAEERLHEQMVGPGKVVVIAAGNERTDSIHIGGGFVSGQTQTVILDVLRQRDGSAPSAVITLWYAQQDDFDVSLITPGGQQLDVPATGNSDQFQSSLIDIELARKTYAWSNSIQVQLSLGFTTPNVPNTQLNGWQLRLTCNTAAVGRIDGWVGNSGFAEFRVHPLVETARTVGLAGTGKGCIAVASHVSKNTWTADLGAQADSQVVVGRTSPFSSLGPTRDGRQKPEISAPGQYITAALADGSELAGWDERAAVNGRVLTIEGTSMATPIMTGVIALMLQKKKTLTPDKIREILRANARRDAHTGPADWNPTYGYGKIDVAAVLAVL